MALTSGQNYIPKLHSPARRPGNPPSGARSKYQSDTGRTLHAPAGGGRPVKTWLQNRGHKPATRKEPL